MIILTEASATHAGAILDQEHIFAGNIKTTTLEIYSKDFPSTTQPRSTFHRELKTLYMRNYVFTYIDDFIIFSTDTNSHIQHLHDVFLLRYDQHSTES